MAPTSSPSSCLADKLGGNRRLIFTTPSSDGDGSKNIQVKLIVAAEYMTTLAYLIAGDGVARGHIELALTTPQGEA